MNRSGRSLPAGPAITPHASSGWSARAWATILSYSPRPIVSMRARLPAAPRQEWSPQRVHQALLRAGKPVVDGEHGITGIIRLDPAHLLVHVLRDAETNPEREPYVVDRAQPDLGLRPRQPDPAAAFRQRVENRPRGRDLRRAEILFRVTAELARRAWIVGVGVGEQPGQRRVVGQAGVLGQ